jgi:transcriptional regulator with XRE-family HTH domain
MHWMTSEPDRVVLEISSRVRTQRARRRWTLDELAQRSTISRRLLVQIEHAEANPSLSTLLKLAAALDLTLTDLIADDAPDRPVAVVPAGDAVTLWDTAAGSTARLSVSDGPLELWTWTLAPGDRRVSEPHRPGSIELLTVQAGILALDVGDDRVEVPAGDSARFDATWPHAYSNPGGTTTIFTLVVLEPAS